jgi:hypothetical protein
MLLYCTASDGGYFMQVPGIGVVLCKDRENIQYRWLPFSKAIPKASLDNYFKPDDVKKLGNIRFSSYWLFEVSKLSFSNAVDTRSIAWQNL